MSCSDAGLQARAGFAIVLAVALASTWPAAKAYHPARVSLARVVGKGSFAMDVSESTQAPAKTARLGAFKARVLPTLTNAKLANPVPLRQQTGSPHVA